MPIVHGLETEYAGRVTVIRLNVDEPANARIQQQYQLRGHPAVAIIDGDGLVTHRFFGPETADNLRAALDEIVK